MNVPAPLFEDTCYSLLVDRAADNPDAPFVTFTDGASHTRAAIRDDTLAVAARLSAAGIGHGDRVLLFIGNRVEFLHYVFACARLGAIIVPINTAQRGDSLAHMLRLAEPVMVVAEDRYLATLYALPDFRALTPAVVDIDAPWAASPTELPEVQVAGSDLAAIMFTSGTTGPSKGVGWSHQTCLYDTYASSLVLGYSADDIIYTCLPLFHINALYTSLFGALMCGGRIVVSPRFSASRFWQDLRDHGVTVTNMLGSMATILWRQEPSEVERAHQLRIALVIPAPTGYYDEFEKRFNLRMTQVYGSTDTSVPIGIPYGERRPGSCGKVLDGWSCLVADKNDFPVRPGVTGELLVRPNRPFTGQTCYWRDLEATVRAWRNLWFHTGDLFRYDDEGWMYYLGRNKDTIRRSGENVSAFEVELAVTTYRGVREAAVFGVPSELSEEEITAVVVGEGIDLPALRGFLEERLPLFAVPRFMAVRDALPKTETEKVRKEQLRQEGLSADMTDLGETRASHGHDK